MKDIRVFYEKKGKIKYTSHLDISRCMQRALKRTGLPVWYTQGFNPHIYVTFPLPLALGVESDCEPMDLRLTEEIDFEEVKEKLNQVLPKGLRITKVCCPQAKASQITSASYVTELTAKDISAENLKQAFDSFVNKSEIIITKKGKKGFKEVDIKPFILEYHSEIWGNLLKLSLRLSAGSESTLTPSTLIEHLSKESGITFDTINITRTAIYAQEKPFE